MKKLIGIAASILILSASSAIAGNSHHRMRYASLAGGHDYSIGGAGYAGAGYSGRHKRMARRQMPYLGADNYWTQRDNSCFNLPNLTEAFACSTY